MYAYLGLLEELPPPGTGTGNSAGVGTASGVGSAIGTIPSVGSSAGVSTASGVGYQIGTISAVGSSSGTSYSSATAATGPTYINSATGTTTCTVPTHAIGDIIVIAAFRASTTAASLGSGYTSILTKSGTTSSIRVGYKIATSTSDASGTWTNAGRLTCHVYRPRTTRAAIGTSNSASGTTTSLSFPTLTPDTDGTSIVAGFIGASSTTLGIGTAPTGFVNRSSNLGTSPEIAGHDTNLGVSSFATLTQTATGTAGNWVSATIEIKDLGSDASSAAGVGAASAEGTSVLFVTGAGTSAGVGSASAVGTSTGGTINSGVGSSAGIGAASAVGSETSTIVIIDSAGTEITNFPGTSTGVNYTGLTISAGLTNSAVLAIVATGNIATAPTGLAVTWDGVPLSLIGGTTVGSTTNKIYLSFFGLANPTPGNKTLAVTWSGGTYSYSVAAMSFKGVDQTTPFQNGTTGTATSSTAGVSVSSAAGNYVVSAYGATVAYNAVDATSLFQDTTASYPVAAANYTTGAATVSLTATLSSSTLWIASGISIKAASSSGAGSSAGTGAASGVGTGIVPSSGSAVKFDAVSSASVASSAGTTLSWTHTPVGTPTAVAVGLQFYPTGSGTPASVTYGGVTMTLAKTATAAPDLAQIWGLANPPSGAQTVVVTFPATGAYCEAGAITVIGSSTTTCFSSSNSATGTSTSATVSLTGTKPGDLLVDICSIGGAATGPTTAQAERWGPLNAGGNYAAGSTVPVTNITASSAWTVPSGVNDWELVAATFMVAGSTGGVGSASAVGTGILSGSGSSAGVGAASGVGRSFNAAAGSSVGIGATIAVGTGGIRLDSTPVSVCVGPGSTITSPSFSCNAGAFVIVATHAVNLSTPDPVWTGAPTATGLTFVQRGSDLHFNPTAGGFNTLSVWYAVAASSFSGTISISTSSSFDHAGILAMAFDGVDGFDTNVSLPVTGTDTTGDGTPSLSGVSTTSVTSVLIALTGCGSPSNAGNQTAGSGFTLPSGATAFTTAGGIDSASIAGEYKIVGATQSSVTVAFGSSYRDGWGMFADALKLTSATTIVSGAGSSAGVGAASAVGVAVTRVLINAASATSTVFAKTIGKIVPITSTSTTSLVRRALKSVVLTSTSATTFVKRVLKSVLVTTASTTLSTYARQVLTLISVSSTSATSLIKSVLKNIPATSASTSSFAKQVRHIVSVTSSSSVVVIASRAYLKLISVASATASSFVKAVGKAVPVTSTSAMTLLKRIGKSLPVSSASATSFLKSIAHHVVITSATASTAVATKAFLVFVNATSATVSTLSKIVGTTVAVTSSTALTLIKSVGHKVVVGAATATSFIKQIAHHLSVTSATSTTANAIRVTLVAIIAGLSTTTSVIKSVRTSISVTATSTVSAFKQIAKSIVATSLTSLIVIGNKLQQFLQLVSVGATSTVTIIKLTGKIVPIVSQSALTIIKTVGKLLSINSITSTIISKIADIVHVFTSIFSKNRTVTARAENRLVHVLAEHRSVAVPTQHKLVRAPVTINKVVPTK